MPDALTSNLARALRRLRGVIIAMVQARWALWVRENNEKLSSDLELESFLFGASRSAVSVYAERFYDLRDKRCFYSGKKLDGPKSGEVDHFIPWARYPFDSPFNLVLASRGTKEGGNQDYRGARSLACVKRHGVAAPGRPEAGGVRRSGGQSRDCQRGPPWIWNSSSTSNRSAFLEWLGPAIHKVVVGSVHLISWTRRILIAPLWNPNQHAFARPRKQYPVGVKNLPPAFDLTNIVPPVTTKFPVLPLCFASNEVAAPAHANKIKL